MIAESRFLITGGAGFIGSHLTDYLVKRGAEVICYDNFSKQYNGKLKNMNKRYGVKNHRLIKGDILNSEELSKEMKGIDVIFHLAAQPGVRYSLINPVEVSRINIDGTINVLEAARRSDIKKIIFASSSSVYGNPRYLPVDEQHPREPISPYGLSKLVGEEYCNLYARLYGMNISVLRYFTVYGPRQRQDMAIYKFVESILKDKSPIVYGDGEQTRDFTFIDDIVQGTILAAKYEKKGINIFNIGGGRRISVNNLLDLIIKFCEKEKVVEPIYQQKKLGDVVDNHADINKAIKTLGYNPQTTLEIGLRKFIDWYVKQAKL